MNKFDRIKLILSNLTTHCYGNCILNSELKDKKLELVFDKGCYCEYHKQTDMYNDISYKIYLGVESVNTIFDKCKSLTISLDAVAPFVLSNNYDESIIEPIIDEDKGCSESVMSDILEKTAFLSGPNFTIIDSLVIEAILFVFGHEIGHFLNDDKVDHNDCFAKENTADAFAIINIGKRLQNADVSNKTRIVLGTLLGFGFILEKTDFKQELTKDDSNIDKHPFTIVRLVNFLKSLDTSDLPDMWQIVYNWSVAWCKKSDISQEVIIDADIIDYKSECERIASELNKMMIEHIESKETAHS